MHRELSVLQKWQSSTYKFSTGQWKTKSPGQFETRNTNRKLWDRVCTTQTHTARQNQWSILPIKVPLPCLNFVLEQTPTTSNPLLRSILSWIVFQVTNPVHHCTVRLHSCHLCLQAIEVLIYFLDAFLLFLPQYTKSTYHVPTHCLLYVMQWERPSNQTPPVSNSHSSYEALERAVSEGRGGYIARGRKYDNVPPLCSHIEGDSCSLYLSRQQERDEGSERKLFPCSYAFGASEWVEGEGSICQEPLSRLLLSCRFTLWGRSIHTLGQPNYAMVDPLRASGAGSCDVRCEASDRCRFEKRVW